MRIEQTPANDIYLVLDTLVPTTQIAKFLSDPRGFLRDHRAELRFVEQMARGYVSRSFQATHANREAAPAPWPIPAPTEDPRVAQVARRRTSLLR